MNSEWKTKRLLDIAEFNPRESLPKGEIAKKVAMDKLQPFYRDIPSYELAPYSGGVKFRNGDTIMAMPIEQLQRLLGHQRIDTTLQYAVVKQSNVKTAHRKYIG